MRESDTQRQQIRLWLETGGQQSFITRLEAMSAAFGLGEYTLLKTLYLNPMVHGGGMQSGLLREVWFWVVEHSDLSHNNPDYKKTQFHNMNLG